MLQRSLCHEALNIAEEAVKLLDQLSISLASLFEQSFGFRSQEIKEYIRRMSLYAGELAEESGFDPALIKEIRLYSSLHDLGKSSIADNVLLKPDQLTNDEFTIMKQHAVFGANLLKDSFLGETAYNIALSHHERWDGTGYPNRLKGTAIPKEARLVAIIDVYDALTSKRAYRSALTHYSVVNYIFEQSEHYFDPELVDAFSRCYDTFPDIRVYVSEQKISTQLLKS